MKIKVRPEDFIVEEVSSITPVTTPAKYKLYKLQKQQWDTMDLVGFLSRKLGIRPGDIALSGIKDRYGATSQLIALKNNKQLPGIIKESTFSLEAVGYSEEPLNADALSGNRFVITIRDILPAEKAACLENFEQIKTCGIPNYYDEQRFGSARHGQGFLGKEIFLGNMEKALQLYLEPSKYDRKEERAFKRFIKENWLKWEKALPLAPPKYRKLVQYMATRGNRRAFTGAFHYIDRQLILLTLYGYQSYLFNQLLAQYLIQQSLAAGFQLKEYKFKYGDLYFHTVLPAKVFDAFRSGYLPVPGANTVFNDPLVEQAAHDLFAGEGITLDQLAGKKKLRIKIKGIDRKLLVVPDELELTAFSGDELYPGKLKMQLRFFLPKGCYATLIVKRLFL